jgi:prevent-host-death family protein
MKHIALSQIKDNLPRFLREAAAEQIVITRHGHPAGILVGFATEEDWTDYRLEHDPRFLARIARARVSIQEGRGVRLEDLDTAVRQPSAPNQKVQRTGASRSPRTRNRTASAAGSRR